MADAATDLIPSSTFCVAPATNTITAYRAALIAAGAPYNVSAYLNSMTRNDMEYACRLVAKGSGGWVTVSP